MVKWWNGVTKNAFTLVWCYGETNMVQWVQRIHTSSHGEMVNTQRWNGEMMKNGTTKNTFISVWRNCETNVVQWRQRIRTSSHGKMVIHSRRRYHLFAKNGEMLKQLYSPSSDVSLTPPLRRRGSIPLLDTIGRCIRCICIGCLQTVPCWSFKYLMGRSDTLRCRTPPPDFDRSISPGPSFRHRQHWGGLPLFSNLLVLTIAQCYRTGDII